VIHRLPGGSSVMGRLSRLFILFAVVAIAFLMLRGGWSEPIGLAKPAKELVGEWAVIAINGETLPKEATVTVDYKADGRLFVRQIGGDQLFILPSAPKLKKAFDEVDPASERNGDLTLQAEKVEVEIRRKPAKAEP
jgi:hypothetical protein